MILATSRGEKLHKRFKITNTFDRPMQIVKHHTVVRRLHVAKPEKSNLEPGESTYLDAVIDTLNVQGTKSVSITVTFGKPYYGQARLTLKCYSRTDIVLSPGEFAIGSVKRGTPVTKTMRIEYAGDPNWRVATVTTTSPFIELSIDETKRQTVGSTGYVGYLLTMNISPNALPGILREPIMLGINDAYNKSIDVHVHGNIVADVTLNPTSLDLKSVTAGQTVSKQALLKGVRPFRISSIESEQSDGPFQIEASDDQKTLHVLMVTLKPDLKPGEYTQEFVITTDMQGERPIKFAVSARIVGTTAASK